MSKPARQRRPSRSKSELRQAILAATEELLAERSFDEISVEDILEATDIWRSSFYLCFESRHAVLAELIRETFSGLEDEIWPWVGHDPDRPLEEMVTASLHHGVRYWRVHGQVQMALIEHWRSDPELAQLQWEFLGSLISELTDRITEAHETGLAPSSDVGPEILGTLLACMTERGQYMAAAGYEPFADDDQFVGGLAEAWTRTMLGGD